MRQWTRKPLAEGSGTVIAKILQLDPKRGKGFLDETDDLFPATRRKLPPRRRISPVSLCAEASSGPVVRATHAIIGATI